MSCQYPTKPMQSAQDVDLLGIKFSRLSGRMHHACAAFSILYIVVRTYQQIACSWKATYLSSSSTLTHTTELIVSKVSCSAHYRQEGTIAEFGDCTWTAGTPTGSQN